MSACGRSESRSALGPVGGIVVNPGGMAGLMTGGGGSGGGTATGVGPENVDAGGGATGCAGAEVVIDDVTDADADTAVDAGVGVEAGAGATVADGGGAGADGAVGAETVGAATGFWTCAGGAGLASRAGFLHTLENPNAGTDAGGDEARGPYRSLLISARLAIKSFWSDSRRASFALNGAAATEVRREYVSPGGPGRSPPAG